MKLRRLPEGGPISLAPRYGISPLRLPSGTGTVRSIGNREYW